MLSRNEWMDIQADYKAEALYRRAYIKGILGRITAALSGRKVGLPTLDAVLGTGVPETRRASRQVALSQIGGSLRDNSGFDHAFNPLSAAGETRWKRIAAALAQGRMLPPVELVQIGERYFVRDGHYRVSAARALGQDYIDALVTTLASERAQAPIMSRPALHDAVRRPI